LVEGKLLQLVQDCLEQQEILETKLHEYERSTLDKENRSDIDFEKQDEMQHGHWLDSECPLNDSVDNSKRKKMR
jgi:hypothetical protein